VYTQALLFDNFNLLAGYKHGSLVYFRLVGRLAINVPICSISGQTANSSATEAS